LPPDINESGKDFTATADGIRFGFAGIRGVGEGVGESIMRERKEGGPFKNLHDFVDRMDAGSINRRVVEALIKSGAFDSTGYTRRQLLTFVDKSNPQNILDAAAKRQKDRAAGQSSLFDMFADVAGSGFESDVPAPDGIGTVVVATGGTSDMPVAEEAAITAEVLGNRVVRLYDIGVAGLHRMLSQMEQLQSARVIIAVAGMEGALTSVIGGLVSCPVIGVPTSVGYGASFGGVAALLAMLNSCASGVSVVNIDNGFGAGFLASRINHMEGK
jgi:NCAIR mutase (PurE)-related protein